MAAARSGAVVKLIPLTMGQYAMVDDKDYDWLNQWKWSATRHGRTYYALRTVRCDDGRRTQIYMHKFITGYARTDHIDGNGVNDQRLNMREATAAQNAANTLKGPRGSSRFKGVSWVKRLSRWLAKCGTSHIGYFDSEIEAALAYDERARARFGEFAVFNFPCPGERSALTGEVLPEWSESRSTALRF
jgi:hypothetical protein